MDHPFEPLSHLCNCPSADRVFVSSPRDHSVAVVDLRRLVRIARIDVGREPEPDVVEWLPAVVSESWQILQQD